MSAAMAGTSTNSPDAMTYLGARVPMVKAASVVQVNNERVLVLNPNEHEFRFVEIELL